ncbi:MAG: thiol:disulfide interchange protein DsbD [Oceanospirillaceae bacterium]
MQPLGNLVVSQPRDVVQAPTHDLNLIKVLPQEVAPLLQQAKLDQQPVMLDFYADWCISCKELDSFVFTDSRVKNALKDFKAIKVDVTINSAAAQQLLQSMQLVGPPALVFYNAKGQLYAETVIGVPAIDDLVTLLQQVNTL